MNNNSKIRKQRITALTLVMTLLMSGCGKNENSRFELIENENNELVAVDDSYISSKNIDDYYVVEFYNKVSLENEIYIARRKTDLFLIYYDLFTNLEIYNGYMDDSLFIFEYVKSTKLSEYIVAFGLGQANYSYDDMKNIYEVIKENYVFDTDNSLSRRRIIDNRI